MSAKKKASIGRVSSGRIDRTPSMKVFQVLAIIVTGVFALLCLMPFVMIISASLTSEQHITLHGYSFLVHDFSLEAYGTLFKSPDTILRAYGVTISITIIGTLLALFLITMAAYVLSRKDFKYRNVISFYFYFTTLFSGGLLSTYIFYMRYLGLRNSLWAMIFPGMFSVFYTLIMRSFINEVPFALVESAKLDGAGEFTIYLRIILPLARSGIVTIGLFVALNYWNEWYNAMLYISDKNMYPLQYMLYDMLASQQAFARLASKGISINLADLPTKSLRMAMTVVAIGPILAAYPFIQKYFVKGVTIGAVKG